MNLKSKAPQLAELSVARSAVLEPETLSIRSLKTYVLGSSLMYRNWLTYAASVVTCSTVFTVVQLLMMPYCCHGAVQI